MNKLKKTNPRKKYAFGGAGIQAKSEQNQLNAKPNDWNSTFSDFTSNNANILESYNGNFGIGYWGSGNTSELFNGFNSAFAQSYDNMIESSGAKSYIPGLQSSNYGNVLNPADVDLNQFSNGYNFNNNWTSRKEANAYIEAQNKALETANNHNASLMQSRDVINQKFANDYMANQNRVVDENPSFYMLYGGLIPKLEMGGIIPNSSNTQVAYGATHEQGGIPYGGAEIEGGGNSNGINKSGEVIRKTQMGDLIYSDTLKPNGFNKTYAKLAKSLSDRKGALEKETNVLWQNLNSKLETMPQLKNNQISKNTQIRNSEKDIHTINVNTAEIQTLDKQLQDLYNNQELQVQERGLRQGEFSKYNLGGNLNPIYNNQFRGSISDLQPTSYVTPTANSNFDLTETLSKIGNLTGNPAIMIGANLANAFYQNYQQKQYRNDLRDRISYEASIPVPQMSRMSTAYQTSSYDIQPQIESINSNKRANQNYINRNTNNAQVARNSKTYSDIESEKLMNQLYHSKNIADKQVYDSNYQNMVNVSNQNNQINYQNSMAQYAKMMDINSKYSQLAKSQVDSSSKIGNLLIGQLGQLYGMSAVDKTMYSDADIARNRNKKSGGKIKNRC